MIQIDQIPTLSVAELDALPKGIIRLDRGEPGKSCITTRFKRSCRIGLSRRQWA